MLNHLGYKDVEFAEDGAEAVKLYKAAMKSGQPFGAVILDLTIPGGMGGITAVSELRKIDPGVRAIVSSGYSSDAIMANYSQYGFSGVLSKPYKNRELSGVLQKVISDT